MEEVKEITNNPTPDDGILIPKETIFPFEKPNNFNLVPNENIERVSLYLPPIIYDVTPNREINIKNILNNTRKMFINGQRYYDKDYWVQHCAASFREILVFIQPINFTNAYKNIPDPQDPEIKDAFCFLIKSTTYLSSVVHHCQSKLMGDAEALYPNQGYGQMNKTDFLKQEANFLERLCIDVVYTLDFIFCKYCVAKKI